MAIVTISRQFGSGGDEIANRICEALGYCRFDKQLIEKAAADAGLPKHIAIDYSEDNHEVKTFIDRLLGQNATPCQKIAWTQDPSIASRPERSDVDELAVLGLVKRAIRAAAIADKVVIVGRGGQVLLKDTIGALHVRVEAPAEFRIQRIKLQMRGEKDYRPDSEIHREALELINTRDKASADYLQRFYNVDWEDPMLYHLILNTGKLSMQQAARAVIDLIYAAKTASVPA